MAIDSNTLPVSSLDVDSGRGETIFIIYIGQMVKQNPGR